MNNLIQHGKGENGESAPTSTGFYFLFDRRGGGMEAAAEKAQ